MCKLSAGVDDGRERLPAFQIRKRGNMRRTLAWSASLVLAVLLAGCSQSADNCSGSDNGSLKVCATAKPSRLVVPDRNAPLEWSEATPPPKNGILSVTVENAGNQDMEVDIQVDVLPGLHFVADTGQRLSEGNRRVTRSGITMRPSETRIVDFTYELDTFADPGEYVLRAVARSTQGGEAEVAVKVTATRE